MFEKKTVCGVCGYSFTPKKEEVYTAAEPRAPFAFFTTPTQFSATDCPRCGCQIPLAVRVPRVTAPDTIERGDEEESEVAEDEDKEHWGDLQEE